MHFSHAESETLTRVALNKNHSAKPAIHRQGTAGGRIPTFSSRPRRHSPQQGQHGPSTGRAGAEASPRARRSSVPCKAAAWAPKPHPARPPNPPPTPTPPARPAELRGPAAPLTSAGPRAALGRSAPAPPRHRPAFLTASRSAKSALVPHRDKVTSSGQPSCCRRRPARTEHSRALLFSALCPTLVCPGSRCAGNARGSGMMLPLVLRGFGVLKGRRSCQRGPLGLQSSAVLAEPGLAPGGRAPESSGRAAGGQGRQPVTGKDLAEGSAGIGAGFSSRHGVLCVLPTADSAQNPGQAGRCSGCPCGGHTPTEDEFSSQL